MERFRRRRTHARVSSPVKVTTIVARSSDDCIISIHRNQLVGKQNKLHLWASDSSTCSSVATVEEKDLLSFNLRSSSSLPTGTTMKKLLADEMSKGTESGRRSPSIIAKLMGLDGLPAQQNANKQQKRLSRNYQLNSGSAGSHKSSKLHVSQSQRKNTKGRQQFKDVYEVGDKSNIETRSNTSHAASNPIPSEDEIAFVRQKFMDVKRFSTDEKFQHSKEFHDALEVLDSNKDLLLKFLQEPDSLYAKHLYDLRGAPESHHGCVLGMKSANSLKCDIDVIGCQSGREASQKIDISYSDKHWDSYYHNIYQSHGIDSHKLSFSTERNECASSFPTKIVVLKPNLGKVQNTVGSVSSTRSSHDPVSDVESRNECASVMHIGSEMRANRSKYDNFDVYGKKSLESRELAREITRRMRNKLGVDSFNVSSSGYKGYSADESSRDVSENDSSCESEVTSCNRSVCNKASALRYMESSVNREAKKRLSERWKLTHRSQEAGPSGKGSTLAEMLTIPDVDIRPRSPNAVVAEDECFRRLRRNDGTAEMIAPLGISSRDGWKDGCMQNLSRSRSLPASSNNLGSPKSNIRHEAIAAERFLIRKESCDGRKKAIKRDSKRKVGSISENKRPSHKELQSYCVSVGMMDGSQEVQSSRNLMNNSIDGKDSPEVKSVILEMPSCRHDAGLLFNAMMDKEHKNGSKTLNCPDEPVQATGSPSCALSQDEVSLCDVPSVRQESSTSYDIGGSSCLQCAATQPESPVSSKESEQPSPVSVLEAPFVEDFSSGSECFEKVSAELHGLRMQLQLLKLESEAYDEGSMIISGDEYGEESTELHDGKGFPRVGESWESSYLVDVLTHSKLDEADYDLFLVTWHSPDCPVDPHVFEDLEKKYAEWELCPRSERRLLFDRINDGIMEISQQFLDIEPWVKTFRRNIGPQWWKHGLKTELHKLLQKHENKVAENATDAVILCDMQWLKFGDHISSVGSDIERLLIDELVADLLPALNHSHS